MLKILYVVPVGHVEGETLEYLRRQLEETFGCRCLLADPLPHPGTAYNRAREQYLSAYILQQLAQLQLCHAFRMLGVADLDLYVPDLNFVFGQAAFGGRSAVIGLPRLRQSFYGLPDDEQLFRQRVVKEAVHELGHTFGLNHCPSKECVMCFSNSLADTDFKERGFCPRCRYQLYGER
jgi:archaemetzincin